MVNPKNKIIKIKGGLGNQLFQIAFAEYLKNQFKLNIKLDISWFKNQKKRSFLIDDFLIKPKFEIINYNNNFIDKVFSYRSENLISTLLKKKKLPKINLFNGYWQDLFFAKYLKEKIVLNKKFFNEKKTEEYYIIHLRRGDFLDSKVHYILPDEYYARNVKFFDDKKIYLLSSDENEAIGFLKKTNIKAEFLNTNEFDAFNLILNASGGIASNSTFCWWSIFLSKNRNWVFPYRWLKKKNIFEHNLNIEGVIIE